MVLVGHTINLTPEGLTALGNAAKKRARTHKLEKMDGSHKEEKV
jgi:hypothetical protein